MQIGHYNEGVGYACSSCGIKGEETSKQCTNSVRQICPTCNGAAHSQTTCTHGSTNSHYYCNTHKVSSSSSIHT